MDTPGLNDTSGIEQDKVNIEKILETVQRSPEFNALVIVVNGSEPRVPPRV